MSIISLVAAIDEANGLGQNNQLLCHLPADLQHFKQITMGKPIIMGRKTYESIGRPLPGRSNIVLSQQLLSIPGVIIVPSLDQALKQLASLPEVMIIGGAQLFAQSMDKANRLYLTKIHHQFTADTFFPAIDKTLWECSKERFQAHDEQNKFDMTFCVYEKRTA